MRLLFILVLLSCFFTSVITPVFAQSYRSDDLVIEKRSDGVFQHISFLKTQDFGKVSCNGMIVVDGNEAVVLDAPAENKAAEALIQWIRTELKSEIKAVVATHFHVDCLGGLGAFHAQKIPSYSRALTIKLARQRDFTLPQHGFDDLHVFNLGRKKIEVRYFGAGHTQDNVVAYVPSENIMFGGCLVKELGAGKGNLEDANTESWAATVEKVKAYYPQVKLIIPGHGKVGGAELLDYTSNLFRTHQRAQ